MVYITWSISPGPLYGHWSISPGPLYGHWSISPGPLYHWPISPGLYHLVHFGVTSLYHLVYITWSISPGPLYSHWSISYMLSLTHCICCARGNRVQAHVALGNTSGGTLLWSRKCVGLPLLAKPNLQRKGGTCWGISALRFLTPSQRGECLTGMWCMILWRGPLPSRVTSVSGRPDGWAAWEGRWMDGWRDWWWEVWVGGLCLSSLCAVEVMSHSSQRTLRCVFAWSVLVSVCGPTLTCELFCDQWCQRAT